MAMYAVQFNTHETKTTAWLWTNQSAKKALWAFNQSWKYIIYTFIMNVTKKLMHVFNSELKCSSNFKHTIMTK